MKDLATGLNAKFNKCTYTSLIFVECDPKPVTRGIGSGGAMHTDQIKSNQCTQYARIQLSVMAHCLAELTLRRISKNWTNIR